MKELFYLNKYFKKYQLRLIAGIIITIIAKLTTLKIPDFIKNSLNAVEDYHNNVISDIADVKKTLLLNIFIIIGITLLGGFFTFLMRQTIIVMSRLIEFDLKNEIFDQYQRLSINFYKKNRTGDLMNRISEDVSKVRMYVGPAIMYSLNMIVSFCIGFSSMYAISPKLTLYTLLPFPLLSISIFVLSKQINKKSTVVQEYLSKLTTFTQEQFSGINIVKSYSIETQTIKSFYDLSETAKSKNLDLVKVQALFFPMMILLIGISNIIVIYYGGIQFINGEIKIGAIAAFIMYVNILTWPVAMVGYITSMVQRAEASQKRINQFLKQVPEIKNEVTENTPIDGDITFKNVTLTYDNTNITALKNVNFTIKQGQTTAILGKTGSGKSSIINLITRLYDCTQGSIEFGNKPLKKHNLNNLRKSIGVVPQNPFLFSENIKNNIKFGKYNANDNEIKQAALIADVDKNIMEFKNGYETIVGERGVTLSGGQKQRIAIARAVIKNPDIIIFDDSLSAVDTETEFKITENLKSFNKDKTTIIITHRVSSAQNADKIIILDNGEISEQGTHNQLINKEGLYKSLYKQQLLSKES